MLCNFSRMGYNALDGGNKMRVNLSGRTGRAVTGL